jgi:hypothetical protein
MKQELITLPDSGVHPRFFGGFRDTHLFYFCVLYYHVSLRSEFCVVMSVTISAQRRIYLQLAVGGQLE